MVLNIGDRYIITAFWGAEEVAIYSAGYNLCMYLKEMIISPLNLALLPMMFKFWEINKTDEIREILSLVIRCLMMIAIPICFLSVIVSEDIMILLASEKYARSAEIIPIILAGVFIQALDFPLSPGLHFAKKTKTFLYIMSTASVMNVALNFLVVPVYGIKGAAVVSLISYVAYTSAYYLISRRYFLLTIPYGIIMKYLLISAVWFCVTKYYAGMVDFNSNFMNAATRTGVFAAGYSVSLYFIDTSIRKNINRVLEVMFSFSKNKKLNRLGKDVIP
jgi:O-antigen/teichoic acid export membrane protein